MNGESMNGESMNVDGKWHIVIDSPLGRQEGVVDLQTDGATLTGTSSGGGMTVDIFDGTVDGDRLRYAIRIKQPMPMKLQFDLTVAGETLSGTVKAGILGRQKVSGARAA
jgi:hypothetical protein